MDPCSRDTKRRSWCLERKVVVKLPFPDNGPSEFLEGNCAITPALLKRFSENEKYKISTACHNRKIFHEA